MARTSKTPRYNEFNDAPNTFGKFSTDPKEWKNLLDTSFPLTLELGCGKAEVTLGMAAKYSKQNYIGVDLKADRLWRASKTAIEDSLTNTAFIQSDILLLEDYFDESSVDVIWITFPDPFPKKRQAKHRMLNRNFLDIYKKLLKADGYIRFKTDNQPLFEWALELLSLQKDLRVSNVSFDMHSVIDDGDDAGFITSYERRFLSEGITTKYLEVRFEQ